MARAAGCQALLAVAAGRVARLLYGTAAVAARDLEADVNAADIVSCATLAVVAAFLVCES